MPRRHITRFESRDGSRVYTFPLLGGDYEETKELFTPYMRPMGANGAVDLLGYAKSISGPRLLAVRNIIDGDDEDEIDANIEDCLAKLSLIGRGKLWTNRNHWTWGRLVQEPDVVYLEGQHLYMPSEATFRLDEDWYGDSTFTHTFNITGTPFSMFLTVQLSTIQTHVMEIEIHGGASGNMTSITIVNLSNGYTIGTNRDLNGSAQRVLIKTGVPSMEYSSNSGGTWTADWANRIIGNNQAQLFRLEPGTNQLQATITGVASGTIIFRYYPVFKI